jgi:cytidylate kinase
LAVVTVSRQHASGGDEIALRLAEKLGYEHVNKELISEVARRASVPESEVERFDDRAESPISRFLSKLFSSERYMSYLGVGSAYLESGVPYYLPDSSFLEMCSSEVCSLEREEFVRFITATILDLYGRGDVVIVGRGGQAILRDKPGVVHVRIIAPFKSRCRRLAESAKLSLSEAAEMLREMDEQRRDFLRQCFGVRPDNSSLYHMILNTARVEEDVAVNLIADLANSVEGKR